MSEFFRMDPKDIDVLKNNLKVAYNKFMDHVDTHFKRFLIKKEITINYLDNIKPSKVKTEYMFRDDLIEELQDEIMDLRERNGSDVDGFVEEMKKKEKKYYERENLIESQSKEINKLKSMLNIPPVDPVKDSERITEGLNDEEPTFDPEYIYEGETEPRQAKKQQKKKKFWFF